MTTELFTRSRRIARGTVTLRELQAALRSDELLFEIALGEPASFGIVVSRSTAKVRRLAGRSTILDQANALVSAVRTGKDSAIEVRTLSATLLSATQELSTYHRLVISAEGNLQQVPFELLEYSSATPPRLLDTHVVSYTPSAATRQRARIGTRCFAPAIPRKHRHAGTIPWRRRPIRRGQPTAAPRSQNDTRGPHVDPVSMCEQLECLSPVLSRSAPSVAT
jgi:hypothetical protein